MQQNCILNSKHLPFS